jgi:hypothetical protein
VFGGGGCRCCVCVCVRVRTCMDACVDMNILMAGILEIVFGNFHMLQIYNQKVARKLIS